MIFFILVGVLIGAVSIIFVLQNITPVTVTFFAYQLNGSLSVILFLAIIAGMLVSIFILLPSFIRDEMRVRKLKRQNKDLADELVATKQNLNEIASRAPVVVVPEEATPSELY